MTSCNISIEHMVWALRHSIPADENIRIVQTIHDDHTIIFNWRNRGYVASAYIDDDRLTPETRVAVGRLHSSQHPRDNSHLWLESLINRFMKSKMTAETEIR